MTTLAAGERARISPARVVRYVGGAGLGIATLVLVLPMVSGTPWSAVLAALGSVPARALALLVLLWAA
ncbi:MAG TPA: hypothetical protein PLZ93_10785, partial [Nocardioides sp.]|nr:hypothetical protein [Nocardioides sp.]